MFKAAVPRARASFCVFWLLVTVLSAPVFSQRQAPLWGRVQHTAPALIHVASNLVIVPVFVVNKGQIDPPEACDVVDANVFFSLTPRQPYVPPTVPKECQYGIHNLSKNDFRIFQDGVQQRIERFARQGSVLSVRDNKTWHGEFSITPRGVWSSMDLGSYCRAHSEACGGPWPPMPFYELGYAPASSESGCHRIAVKVDVPNVEVLASERYCIGQTPTDPLHETSYGEHLAADMEADKRAEIPLSLQAGYLYSDKQRARVNVTLAFPWNRLNHKWDELSETLRARIGVLGVAYGKNGTPVARFSDLLYPSYWPAFIFGWADLQRRYRLANGFPPDPFWVGGVLAQKTPGFLPSRYQTQLDLPPGHYDLRVVLSDEKKFGRANARLDIPEYNGKQLALSSVIVCKRYRDAHVAAVERAAANFAPQYVPLVSKGIEFTPAGDTTFRKGEDPLIGYFEIYDPLLAAQPKTQVETHVRIVSATGQVVRDFPAVDAATYIESGKAAIHIARKIPFDKLPKGSYRLEVQATDSAGHTTSWQSAGFTVVNEAKH